MSKGNILIPIIVLLAAGLIVASVIFVPKKLNTGKPSPAATGSAESKAISPTNEVISKWKQYENVGFRLRFKYPPELSTKELFDLGPNYMQINLLEASGKAQGIFMIKTLYEKEEVTDFVGTKPHDVKNLGGQTWYFFNFPQGFSNSPPFTAYQDEKNGILYSFKFYNLVNDKIRDQIMTTVEIIPSI